MEQSLELCRQMSQSRLPAGVELQQESSDDSDEVYTVESAIDDWFYGKSTRTISYYNQTIKRFRKFLEQKYSRGLERARKKHVRAYLTLLSDTNRAARPTLCVLKSLYKHLKRLGVIKKDPVALFKLEQQLPCRIERSLTSDQVRSLFAKAQQKRDKTSFYLLLTLTYSGCRIGACSRLRCADIVKTTTDAGDQYKIKIIKGKCNRRARTLF